MDLSSKIKVFLVFFIIFSESQGFILERIKGKVKNTKCKLHSLGNSIFAHEHKHGNPCESEDLPKTTEQTILENPHFLTENIINIPYSNQDDHNEQHFDQNNNSNGGNKDVPVDNKYEDKNKISDKIKDDNTDVVEHKADNKDSNSPIEKHHEEETTKTDIGNTKVEHTTTKKPKILKHKKYGSDYSEEEDSKELSVEETESTTTPKFDIRFGQGESTSYVPVAKGDGRHIISVKCNKGTLVAGDDKCREEV